SLYRTSNHYRSLGVTFGGSTAVQRVTPAYYPGPETQAACNSCNEGCARALAECTAAAVLPLAGCVFPPACPGAVLATGAALAACVTASPICSAVCATTKCCPKICGVPNPFDPGSGCCDTGEACVDSSDPNARQGCCPSGQSVCGGKCCAIGDTCCGDECCPAGWFCIAGSCTQYPSFPTDGPPPPPPPPEPGGACKVGWEACPVSPSVWLCCPPGKECCGSKGCQRTCVA